MEEGPGNRDDLNFIGEQTDWLKTCIVSHSIEERSGRFWVVMIFTDAGDPLRKLVRPISDHSTRRHAEWHANILQRQISADPRDPRPKNSDDAEDIRDN